MSSREVDVRWRVDGQGTAAEEEEGGGGGGDGWRWVV